MISPKAVLLAVCMLELIGCAHYTVNAPVRDINVHYVKGLKYHQVQSGETLYAVAWRYDRDYRELAQLNHLRPPYALHPGDKVLLSKSTIQHLQKENHHKKSTKKKRSKYHRSSLRKHRIQRTHKQQNIFLGVCATHHWIWPVQGRVVHGFSLARKGIDIAGKNGQAILAARGGQVVYSGSGIRGYGHLLIIKNDLEFLSAYAYNRKLFVHEGDRVKTGQRIAEMGTNNHGLPLLHFEIRQRGQPVNPLRYLKRK